MGTTQTGESELIRLTAVDFFTGAALVDSLIVPSVPMQHYNTRYSGVTAAMMREASRSGNCIRGRDAAREALWRFVGPETVVVVHGGENDMTALRWICGRVVDTFLLSEDMKKAEALKGGRSLKSLSLELLGRRVQEGKRGHDSLEDALATREVANWFIGVG
jgi:RNA exonuclease 1